MVLLHARNYYRHVVVELLNFGITLTKEMKKNCHIKKRCAFYYKDLNPFPETQQEGESVQKCDNNDMCQELRVWTDH